MNPVVRLPGTKTAGWREAEWQQVLPGLGILTIREAAREGLTVRTSRYLVREDIYDDGTRIFILTKAPGETVYGCGINPHIPNGRADGCGCNGWSSGKLCKHVAALQRLIAAGYVEKPEVSESV